MSSEQITSRNHSDDLARPVAMNNREPADVVIHHVVGGVAQCAVVVNDRWWPSDQFREFAVAANFGVEQVPTRQNSDQEFRLRIKDRKSLVLCTGYVRVYPQSHFTYGLIRAKRDG